MCLPLRCYVWVRSYSDVDDAWLQRLNAERTAVGCVQFSCQKLISIGGEIDRRGQRTSRRLKTRLSDGHIVCEKSILTVVSAVPGRQAVKRRRKQSTWSGRVKTSQSNSKNLAASEPGRSFCPTYRIRTQPQVPHIVFPDHARDTNRPRSGFERRKDLRRGMAGTVEGLTPISPMVDLADGDINVSHAMLVTIFSTAEQTASGIVVLMRHSIILHGGFADMARHRDLD